MFRCFSKCFRKILIFHYNYFLPHLFQYVICWSFYHSKIRGSFNYSRNYIISEKYKNCNHLSNIFFVGNIYGAVLWKPFQLLRRILNDVSGITKAPSLQCWFHSREQIKISRSQVRSMGDVQCWHIVLCYKFFTKTDRWAGALSWRGNQPLLLHFSGRFLLTASLRRRRISAHVTLLTVTISVNYTSEFGEIF